MTGGIYMKTRILSPAIAAAMLLTASAPLAFAEGGTLKGAGTEDNPYLIESADDFGRLASAETGEHYKLTKNIFLGDNGWSSPVDLFKGIFDGSGHILTIKKATSGLFGTIDTGAEVKNLNVSGYITAAVGTGSLTRINKGTVTNCGSSCEVNTALEVSGGIVGTNYGRVEYCYNTGYIEKTYDDGGTVGGIVGINQAGNGTISNLGGTVKYCYNTGRIAGGNSTYVGGVAGQNYGSITDSYNAGPINGKAGGFTGGVAGVNGDDSTSAVGDLSAKPSILNCYNSGSVEYGYAAVGKLGNGNITRCYYLEGTAETGDPGESNANAKKLTKEQFLSENSFTDDGSLFPDPYAQVTGWNFTSTWMMSPAFDRPILRVLPESMPIRGASGTGTESDPFLIGSEADMTALSNAVSNGSFYKISIDFDLGESYTYPENFSGTLDGDWHTVTIKNADRGLFDTVSESAAVKNITVTGTIRRSGNDDAGSIAVRNDGRIENCSFTGTLCGGEDVGGIVGRNYGLISYCTNSGDISAYAEYYDSCIGGIAGKNDDFDYSETTGIIEYCINSGTLTHTEGSKGIIGGIVGINAVGYYDDTITLRYCKNTGDVSGISGDHTGGIAGDNRGTITQSYSSGSVTGGLYIGGVAGDTLGVLTDCYNAGSLNGNSASQVGGVAGNISCEDEDEWIEGEAPKPSIVRCYSCGKAVRSEGTAYGIAGNYIADVVNDCYYLSSTAAAAAPDSAAAARGLLAKHFAKETTFDGWDFKDKWQMSGTLFRPVLKIIPEQGEAPTVVEGEVTKVLAENSGVDSSGNRDSGATAFITVISKTGSGDAAVTGVTWTITTSENESKSFDESDRLPSMTFTEGTEITLALLINGLYAPDADASVTAE